jgi:hypothetical protein
MGARRGDQQSGEQLRRSLDELEAAAVLDDSSRVIELADELWQSRRSVVPILVDRLSSGQARAPLVLLQLLPTFAGSGARQHLSRVARDARAPDLVRFSARRRMGWAERGERNARIKFLDSLQDPVATLAEALEALRGGPYPPSGETLEEVVKHLLVMPPNQAREVVTLGVRTASREISWLLRALLHAREPSLRALALEGILEVGDEGAAPAMERAAEASGDPDFASRVAAARQHLATAGIADRRGRKREALPPIHSTYLSAIDGSGGQVAIALREREEGLMMVAQLHLEDGWGVRDAIGVSSLPWEAAGDLFETRGDRLAALRGELEGEEIPLVEVPAAALRGALARAERANAAGRPLPREYEIWEPLVHDEDPPAPDEAVVAPEMDDSAYADREELYRRSGELLEHPFFQSWIFEPGGLAGALGKGVPPPLGGKLTMRHFRAILDALLDDSTRMDLRIRLRRQAWLLGQAHDPEQAEAALAAAVRLAGPDTSEFAHHPLLQRMVTLGMGIVMGRSYQLG